MERSKEPSTTLLHHADCFVAKAIALKQQISKLYTPIKRTEARYVTFVAVSSIQHIPHLA